MPILIEDMEAEVMPEREAAPVQRDDARERRQQQAQLLERLQRELRMQHERRTRWRAD